MLGMTLIVSACRKDRQLWLHLLSENESDGPEGDDDGNPSSPSDNTVTVCVSRATQDSLENELGCDVGVKSADDDGRDENESKGRFSLPWLKKRSDRGGGRVLSEVVVSDGSNDTEEDKLKNGQGSESFGEVLGLFHFGDERGVQNLTNPEESDAEGQRFL
jgi:hypothetical protein